MAVSEGSSIEKDNETQLSQNDANGHPISGSSKKEEEGEKGGDERHWPPELLQMIFCRLPFPSLQKLPGISKYWKHVFSSATLEGRKFQTDFLSVSSRWPQFCPVYLSSQPSYHSIWGFNQSTRSWEEIHTHIPRTFPDPNRVGQMQQTILFGQLSGALVCLVQRTAVHNRIYHKELLEVRVLNIFTRNYRVMPPLREAEVSRDADPELIPTIFRFFPDLEQIQWGTRSPDDFIFASYPEERSYNVYLMYESTCAEENREFFQNEDNLRRILIFQYMSARDRWTVCLTRRQRNSDRFESSLGTGSTAYLNGVIYTMSLDPIRVWAYATDDAIETDAFGDDEHRSYPLNLKTESLRAWGVVEVYNLLMVALVIKNVAYIHKLRMDAMDWMLICESSTDIGELERKRKRKEVSSSFAEEDNEEQKLHWKRQRDDSSQASGNQSDNGNGEDRKAGKETNENWRGQKIKRPHYHVVSDSRCIYFCPLYTSDEPILVYTVIDREWSTIRLPKMNKECEMKLLAGCARPGDNPLTPVYTRELFEM